MIALKAIYEKGRIKFLEPMPDGIDKAELHIIVIPAANEKKDQTISSHDFDLQSKSSENEFKEIGLAYFFNTEDDANIDWEDYFGLK